MFKKKPKEIIAAESMEEAISKMPYNICAYIPASIGEFLTLYQGKDKAEADRKMEKGEPAALAKSGLAGKKAFQAIYSVAKEKADEFVFK